MEPSQGTGITNADREAMRRYRETHRTLSLSVHLDELKALRRFVAGSPVPVHDLVTVVDVLTEGLEDLDNAERLRAEDEAAETARGGRS